MFQGFVACGGFSYGDTLGAGEGWARSILFNPKLADQFATFFARRDVFALGVCNGCQMMAALAAMIPGAEDWPRFTRNRSEQFEARLSLVEVLDSPSIFFTGMAGSRAADRGRARRGLRRLLAAWRRRGRDPGDALHRPPRPADDRLSREPEWQCRRPDRGDHRRRALHRPDAAPGAGLQERADELDARRLRPSRARGCGSSRTRAGHCDRLGRRRGASRRGAYSGGIERALPALRAASPGHRA